MNLAGKRGSAARSIAAYLACAALSVGLGTAADVGSVVITSKVTILENVNENGPVRLAAQDLQNDFAKVFGAKPRIVTNAAEAGPLTIMIGEESEIPAGMRPAGATAPESFSISVQKTGNGHAVVLAGPDKRGTIYAIYQFSQDYLGVDPMYYWTDKEPAKRSAIALAASLSKVFPPPLFKYRGFFINDEDLLTGWAPGEATDHTGIALKVWNKIFETVLRLKGNMIVPGTWIFPTDPQVKAVGERGLILAQHHATPLGVNVARWPANVPYNYTTHPEILERAWKDAVASYDPHQEILWTVGLRGLSDSPYSAQDPSVVGNDKHQGELISKAIAAQMAIVRAVQPNAHFITNLWMEGNRLMREGYLKIPPDVTTVWADSGYGIPHDDGEVSKGQGVYYHVMMYNGRANQLSEMVPVSRIDSELGRYIKAGATAHFLVNTSDIRPAAMTAEAVMDVAWGGVKGSDADYYKNWSSTEFGAKAAAPAAKVYEEYFKAFPHIPAGLSGAGEEYGDQLYQSEAQQMVLATIVSPPYYLLPAQAPTWTPVHILGLHLEPHYWIQMPATWVSDTSAREIKVCGEAQSRWNEVWKDALAARKFVLPDRRNYYDAEMLTMIAINRDGNHILYQVSEAVRDFRAGDKAKARAEAMETYKDFDEIAAYEKRAEYGKWKNWYRGEWLDGIRHTRQMVEAFVRFIDDPEGTLPAPVLSDHWQGYYHIMHYEGDRTVDVH
ncbi:MAG: glycosyl hydrolase 115 family protein [Alphaproteobacteria bacterium]|nr:glycosyl hydrolase 115 family protein [Alphaproteobacteria bacterium]